MEPAAAAAVKLYRDGIVLAGLQVVGSWEWCCVCNDELYFVQRGVSRDQRHAAEGGAAADKAARRGGRPLFSGTTCGTTYE